MKNVSKSVLIWYSPEEMYRLVIRSWNSAGWFDAPRRAGDKIARLVGAGPNEVVATDSTSINLFKVLAPR